MYFSRHTNRRIVNRRPISREYLCAQTQRWPFNGDLVCNIMGRLRPSIPDSAPDEYKKHPDKHGDFDDDIYELIKEGTRTILSVTHRILSIIIM